MEENEENKKLNMQETNENVENENQTVNMNFENVTQNANQNLENIKPEIDTNFQKSNFNEEPNTQNINSDVGMNMKDYNLNIGTSTQENNLHMGRPGSQAQKVKNSQKNLIMAISIVVVIIVAVIAIFNIKNNKENEKKLTTYYLTMQESVEALDSVADEIYNCWYDAVYNDMYYDSIDWAIVVAFDNEKSNVDKIEENDPILSSLLSDIRNSNIRDKDEEAYNAVLDMYDAYKEYYEFTINVSGSFNSYSAQKEDIKKETKSCLNKLERCL